MDLANDERIRALNDLIQTETDCQKLLELVEELDRLLGSKMRGAPINLRDSNKPLEDAG